MKLELSKEQEEIAKCAERILIVKGTAGSGKTLVGLARAEMILEDQARSLFTEQKGVLFLGYNNSIVNELTDKKLEYCEGKFSQSIEIRTYDNYFYSLTQNLFKKEHSEYRVSSFNREYFVREKRSEIVDTLATELHQEQDFIIDELRYIMYNGFSKSEYLEVVRKHRKGRLTKDVREKIYNALIKYRHMLKYENKIDIYDVYNWFLIKYLGEYKEKYYTEDVENSEIAENKASIFQTFSKIKAIIVDESQDLCRLKIRTLQKLMEIFGDIGYLTFLYDISQSIYESSYFNSITSFKSIGINARKSVKTLGFSYRSTRQIHQCAYSLLSNYSEKDDANELHVNPVFGQSDEGVQPIVLECPSIEAEYKMLYKMIKVLLDKYNYTTDDIIVISQNVNKEDIDKESEILDSLDKLNAKENSGKDSKDRIEMVYISSREAYDCNRSNVSIRDKNRGKIRIYNPYNVKGLEAKAIFMIGNNIVDERKTDEEIAKYYYVQMTRAMELLFILSVEEANKYIQSIEEKYVCKLEYSENLNIAEKIDSSIKTNTDMLEGNKLKRYAGVQENLKKKMEVEKEYQKKLDLKEKTIENDNSSHKLTMEECVEKVEKDIGVLPEIVIKNIAFGLYYSETTMDIETAYGKYAKALELVLKEIYKDKEMTLGEMVHDLQGNKDYKQFANEIIRLGFIKVRNRAIHSSLDINNKKDLEVIHDYILKDKKLLKLYNKILKVRERDENSSAITKLGTLITKGCKSKIHGKELYLYLINNEDFGACSKLIKEGTYELNGKYQNSNGKQIFIIDKYKSFVTPQMQV